MESIRTSRMSTRRRPLHTCGVSFLEIAHKVYTKAQDFNGPLGSATKNIARLASLTSPLIYTYLYLALAILSFMDHCILGLENIVEVIFPPSKCMFNKIDYLVQIIEAMPGKFDELVDMFPPTVHQGPLLDWALTHAISWLNFWLSTLVLWGSGNAKEKEILVDIGCTVSINKSVIAQEANQSIESHKHGGVEFKEDSEAISPSSGLETESVCPRDRKGTYKDALEKGTKLNIRAGEDGTEEIQKSIVGEEEAKEGGTNNIEEKGNSRNEPRQSDVNKEETDEEGRKQSDVSKEETGEEGRKQKIKEKEDSVKGETEISSGSKEATQEERVENERKMEESTDDDDQILELFESAWLMNPGKKVKGNAVPGSGSYT